MTTPRFVRVRALAVALPLLFAACSSGSSGSNGASTLYPLATKVEEAAGNATFQPGLKGDHLNPGDSVRTDATGHAELDWPDGSLTRLGPATTLKISPLARPDKHQVKLHLDVGQTWHRVERVTGSGGYEVETPVGVATVRGTRFAVTCAAAPVCTFQVVDGTVAVTPPNGTPILVAAGQVLTVKQNSPPGAPQTVGVNRLNADPFIAENERLDSLPRDQRSAALTSTTTTTSRPRTALIVISGRPMRTVNPDSGAVQNLAAGGDNPAWSFDRSHIAYDRDGDVYVANADGSGERAVVTGTNADADPTWSPDGKSIAFARDTKSIQVVNADGSGLHQLAVAPPPDPNTDPPNASDATVAEPIWSPDGSRVAFTVDYFRPIFEFVPARGGPVQKTPEQAYSPDWSPDGKQIVTGTRGNTCSFGLYLVDPVSGKTDAVVDGGCSFTVGGRWSPDGTRIAYVGEPPGGKPGADCCGATGVRVVGIDGKDNRVVLDNTSEFETTIDW